MVGNIFYICFLKILNKADTENFMKSTHIFMFTTIRYMTGEKNNNEIDIYIIEKAFGIKIKDYSING